MNLLIVDDEILEVEVVEKMIDREKLGITEIYKAYSAAQAREIMENHEISILLSDIEMPKGSGHGLVKWVREQQMDVVSIFLTSHAVFGYVKKAMSLGVNEYLLKPVDKEELEMALKKAVEIAKPFQVKKSTDVIGRVKAYISDNLDREISRAELAEAVYLHPDYLSHYFKEKTGTSISAYIANVRMEHAKVLLLGTDEPVSEIAASSGYANTAYFTKMFKRATGMTPTEYRRAGMENEK